jgi:hypothetical protein
MLSSPQGTIPQITQCCIATKYVETWDERRQGHSEGLRAGDPASAKDMEKVLACSARKSIVWRGWDKATP